jgi:hypothetical protein
MQNVFAKTGFSGQMNFVVWYAVQPAVVYKAIAGLASKVM